MAEEEQNQESGVEQKAQESYNFTKEELDAIQKDIDTATESLKKKSEEAKEEGKQEAQKEHQYQEQIKQKEQEIEQLKNQYSQKETELSEKLNSLQSKIDEMAQSKAVVAKENPFEAQPATTPQVDKWSEEKIKEIEEESARQFLGDGYDDRFFK